MANLVPYNDGDYVEAELIDSSEFQVDLTDAGQLSILSGRDRNLAIEQVFSYLPLAKQTQDSLYALEQCLSRAPVDFSGIAKKYGVPAISINQPPTYHQESWSYDQSIQPEISPVFQGGGGSFTPIFQPVIEVRPEIHLDTRTGSYGGGATAYSRSSSEDNSTGSRFWGLIALFIAFTLFAALFSGGD